MPISISDDESSLALGDFSQYTTKCKTCKIGLVSIWGKRVNCDPCVARNREKERQKRARKLATMQRLAQHATNDWDTENTNSTTAASTSSPIPPSPVTRQKDPMPLAELEGKEREAAMRTMKRHVDRLVSKTQRYNPYPPSFPDPDEGTEYQNATGLYNALRTSMTSRSKRVEFKGYHIIVADPSINQKKRLELVSVDLDKIVRVQFNRFEPISRQRTKTESMRNATYQCNCRGFASAADPPAPKASKKDLMGWVRATKKLKTEGEKKRVECGGTVKIVVSEDTDSHPYGIPGQKILVEIKHWRDEV